MRDIIIDLQKSDTWKIQLTVTINYISWKDAEEEHVMHLTSSNRRFVSYNNANEVVDKRYESLFSRYQGNLEKSMERSGFIYDSVQLIYYICHKVDFRRGGSYINSSE